jgi:hypothetical protein
VADSATPIFCPNHAAAHRGAVAAQLRALGFAVWGEASVPDVVTRSRYQYRSRTCVR